MADRTDTEPESAPPEIDVTKAHPARMYDYFLGGKDNFAADRAVAAQVLDSWGSVRTGVRENRSFLGRTVRYLASEAGISQFLDIGTGLPSANNVHEVAQAVNPEARVVYADNDPIVLTHARAGRAYRQGGMRGAIRNSDVFADLAFTGLNLVDPGVVLVSEWRAERDAIRPLASEVNTYGGVARKP